jgi:hypothetical protein
LSVAKTKPDVRLRAINSLQDAEWVRSLGVTLEDLVDAEGNEDDFDACFTAAALLRCVLERSPIELVADRAAPAEGGMLGTGSINLDLPERSFGSRAPGGVPSREASPRTYSCPIPGCGKMYRGSRGGWDSHVASLRIHPSWHPELQDEADRKQTYRSEFPDFFR